MKDIAKYLNELITLKKTDYDLLKASRDVPQEKLNLIDKQLSELQDEIDTLSQAVNVAQSVASVSIEV
jgi:hypothetical protein